MKKVLILLTVITLLLSTSVFAADFKDMPDNWATEALNAAVDNGLINGSDGYIYPDNPMTRAEMAAIITRATGAKKEADISKFTDVTKDDWFYSVMAKAVNMKAFNGSNGKLNPNSNITRQEAFVVLARVFGLDKLADKEFTELSKFSDGIEVADWAKKEVNMIIKSGFVSGSGGKINPLSNITRAEFAVVMNRLVKYYIDEPGEYTPENDGNIMIRCSGVTINDLATDKIVCVGDLDESEEVIFNKCDIKGQMILRGGKSIIDGNYVSIKGLGKAVTVDITTLSADVIKNLDIFMDGGSVYIDYLRMGNNE